MKPIIFFLWNYTLYIWIFLPYFWKGVKKTLKTVRDQINFKNIKVKVNWRNLCSMILKNDYQNKLRIVSRYTLAWFDLTFRKLYKLNYFDKSTNSCYFAMIFKFSKVIMSFRFRFWHLIMTFEFWSWFVWVALQHGVIA